MSVCSVPGCNNTKIDADGWQVKRRKRRHFFCSQHFDVSDKDHWKYKEQEKKALINFDDAQIKAVIQLRKLWQRDYMRKAEHPRSAHSRWIYLLEALLVTPKPRRASRFPKLLNEF